MEFSFEGKTYSGESASDIVAALQRGSSSRDESESLRGFIRRSFEKLKDTVPNRELQIPDRLDDETLARYFLCLCDEYGEGKLHPPPNEGNN